MGELFGFSAGTTRTALSRLVAAGDLVSDDGVYELAQGMLERQAFQDAGRSMPATGWDGTWWIAIAEADGRPLGERRAFRTLMRHHRMGELRPDIWMRPANVAGPPATAGALVTRGPIADHDPADLVRRLWDLNQLAALGRKLVAAVDEASGWLDTQDPAVLPDTFMVSVAVVRYLLGEPQLPPELVPADWPAHRLRSKFERLDPAHQALMRSFLSRAAANV